MINQDLYLKQKQAKVKSFNPIRKTQESTEADQINGLIGTIDFIRNETF